MKPARKRRSVFVGHLFRLNIVVLEAGEGRERTVLFPSGSPDKEVTLDWFAANDDRVLTSEAQLFILSGLGLSLEAYLREAGEWPPRRR